MIAAAVALYTVWVSIDGTRVIATLAAYWGLVAALTALHAAMTVARRYRRVKAARATSWLTAAPIRSTRIADALAVSAPLLLQWLALMLLLAMAAMDEVAQPASLLLAASFTAGMIGGAACGKWLARSRSRERYEESRYVPAARMDLRAMRPSDAALSRMSGRRALAWSRPENSRLLLLVALFAVQGGSTILQALAVIAMWTVAGYLGSLLAAVAQVAREAGAWLRSTPIRFHEFAWPIARRALLHQALGTLVAVVVMVALDAPISLALYYAALWLTMVVLISAISLAESYRANSPALRLSVSLTALTAIEAREQGWSIPLAALLIVWQLRRGASR
jgi:hypothetical protein